jgi:hypothetical protein
MKPIEFIVFNGDSSPNTPVHEIATAMEKHMRVYVRGDRVEVVSYFYDTDLKRMVLELGETK